MIASNIESVRQRIAKACSNSGRSIDDVRLVCVTKEATCADAKQVLGLGVRDLGENRVQELVLKYNDIGDKAVWHLIGHLQTNKVRDVVKIASLIHSVDSEKIAKEIDKEAAKINKIQGVLIQVNISGEETKFGIDPGEVSEFFKKITLYRNINIKGLMTIAPESEDPERARPHFRALRELKDKLNSLNITQHPLAILSMGMTGDFEVAIEEGSNMIRVGRAIFGG